MGKQRQWLHPNGSGKKGVLAQRALFQAIAMGGWQTHAQRRTSDDDIGLKVKEVIDDILIQERLEAAQKKRDARNAKRLKNMRK